MFAEESPGFTGKCLITHPELADLIGRLKLDGRFTVRADSATIGLGALEVSRCIA
jgi:hypothetical protein